MNKEFVPYEESLALKELGFDEPCFTWYWDDIGLYNGLEYGNHNKREHVVSAPTYSQAFRWFREEYKFHAEIRSYTAKYFTIIIQELKDIVRYLEYGGIDLKFNTYEEAELACLIKLIEIVKNKKPDV